MCVATLYYPKLTENKMFTFKLPTYEELKQNYETYLKDVQKFYKDFYSDIQKTFNK